MQPGVLLPLLFALQTPTAPAPQPAAAPAATAPAQPLKPLKPLSFHSERFPYKWDTLLPVNYLVDGVKVTTIFFNRRQGKWLLKGADFGARAQVEVTNTTGTPKVAHFAVAVFDEENRLLGAANGGTKVGTLNPGETDTFDMNFSHVNERLPLGAYFYLSIELTE